jgi:hypothetical protein
MQAMDMIDESEDDMAPLLTALEKAKERAEKMTKIRMANESEALEIAGMAIAMKEKVDSANTAVEETVRAIKKREEQLKRLTASKVAIDEEELRLSQGDALASVDSPLSSDAASVGVCQPICTSQHAVKCEHALGCGTLMLMYSS